MPRSKKKRDWKSPSAVARLALLKSGAGVHADQNRRKSAKALRRDKTYKEESS